MAEVKKFLDLTGLKTYDAEIKKVIAKGDEDTLTAAKKYHDDNSNFDPAGTAATKVQELSDGQVAQNKAAIEKLNGSEATEGSVDYKIKQAIDTVNGEAATLSEKVTANENAIKAINAADTGILAVAEADATAKANAAQVAAEAKVTALAEGAVKDNTEALTILKGEGVGSVKKAIDDAISEVTADASALETRVEANETAIAAINNTETGIAKVAADALSAAKTELEGKITAEASAARAAEKTNADAIAKEKERMDTLLEGADIGDEAIDTLKEIQDYISSHGAQAAEMVTNIGKNKTAIENEVARVGAVPEEATADTVVGYIDEKVTAENTRATGVEDGLNTRLTAVEAKFTGEESVAKQIETAVAAEKTRAEGKETANANAIADHETRIAALEGVSFEGIADADIKALFGIVSEE